MFANIVQRLLFQRIYYCDDNIVHLKGMKLLDWYLFIFDLPPIVLIFHMKTALFAGLTGLNDLHIFITVTTLLLLGESTPV